MPNPKEMQTKLRDLAENWPAPESPTMRGENPFVRSPPIDLSPIIDRLDSIQKNIDEIKRELTRRELEELKRKHIQKLVVGGGFEPPTSRV